MSSQQPKPIARKRRRTQEERRTETTGKLLNATIDLLLENGYSKFRIVDAAKKAKVSRGGQTHHFSTKNELIEAAIQSLFASEVSQAQADADNTSDEDLIHDAARHAHEFLNSKLFRVSLNMLISSGDQAHLAAGVREISAQSREPIERAWVDRIVRTGISVEQAETILSLLWVVQRGLVVERTIEGSRTPAQQSDYEFAVDLLDNYVKRSVSE